MPSPNGSTSYSSVSLSGTPNIDSLLGGTKWGGILGTGATLSYSFLSANSVYASLYSDDNEYLHSYQLTGNQQTAVSQALAAWSAVANIRFLLTVDSSSNVGDLRFGGYADMSGDSAAWAYLPGDTPSAGDMWIGPATSETTPKPGSYDYLTFLHEIGHALGLKHPFETPNVLATALDDVRYTVMSYNDQYSFEPTTPMLLDIAAIQYLYGANMQWHTGNDTYQWSAGQQIFETIWDAGGVDTLSAANRGQAVTLNLNAGAYSSIGATRNLAIAYGARIENAVGSAYADTLIGNAQANTLNGGAGADQLVGGDGADLYYVDNSGDNVSETNATASSGGIDTVYSYLAAYTLGANVESLRLLSSAAANGTGNALNNLIVAGAGNNVLNGGAGADTASYAYAGAAVTLSLASTAAQATGGSGSDTLLSFENLTGSNYNDRLTGNAAANVLSGGGGNDMLDGGAGADRLVGGDGSDLYYVDNSGDSVSETSATAASGGIDTVYSYLSAYTLGANVENLRLLSSAAANGTGNALNNLISAGAGNNVLNGGAGLDTASYAYTGGAVTLSLATTSAQATGGSGSDTLLNFENLTGSNYNDRLTGNAVANVLSGGAGNDTLSGGAGGDWLVGGLGIDALNGGSGADRFVFGALPEMGLGTLRDVIGDFKTSEGDRLDLAGLDANSATVANEAFSFIGSNPFSSNATGQLRFVNNVLYGSTDADTAVEFEVQLLGVATLSSADLIV